MKRYILLVIVVGLFVSCQKKHPVKVHVDPVMEEGAVEQIAVFPFASSLHPADDPDGEAPEMMDRLFRQQLDTRDDYKFVSPTTVEYALRGAGLEEQAKQFVDQWRTKKEVDRQFLTRLSQATPVEAVLIGVVDLWQKDEVDYRETGTPATYVGATISILRVSDGLVLFEASDEDLVEGSSTEAADRGVARSASGAVQADRSSNIYRAPDYKEVAAKVARALALSIPPR